MRIGVLVDSSCDLPQSFIAEHGIIVMPITLRIGEKLLEDRRDPVETLAFYETYLDRKSEDFSGSTPYTAEQIERLFLERLVLDFDYVFCLTVTSERSQIYDNAMKASLAILAKYKQVRRDAGTAARFGLAVLSSRNMFTGHAVQAAEAVRLIRSGATPSEIGARLNELVKLTHAYLLPVDLFHIYKRASKKGEKSIGWGSYMVGSLLDVKPIVHMNQDTSVPVAKVRGFEVGAEKLFANATARMREGLKAPFICVSYGGPLDQLPAFPGCNEMLRVAAECGVEVLVTLMSTTAAVNVGPGALSLAFAAVGQTLE